MFSAKAPLAQFYPLYLMNDLNNVQTWILLHFCYCYADCHIKLCLFCYYYAECVGAPSLVLSLVYNERPQ